MYKELLEIVGNGSPLGSVLDETIAVSATISLGVENNTVEYVSEFLMKQNERKASRTRRPREEVPVVECLDGLATITLKELAQIHSVKSGILQNACFTSPRVDVDLKNALMHTVKLMNSLVKGPKRMMTSAVALLKSTRQLDYVLQDMDPPKSSSIFTEELKHKETNPMCSVHRSCRTSC